jgi:hypothetical protein
MKESVCSPVFAIGAAFHLLLFVFLIGYTSGDHGLRFTIGRVFGLTLGLIVVSRRAKGRVTVWSERVKGPLAEIVAGSGALLAAVSIYSLATSPF